MSLVANLINALIILLIIGVVWYAAKFIAGKLGAPPPIGNIIDILCVLVALIWFLSVVGGYGGRLYVVA